MMIIAKWSNAKLAASEAKPTTRGGRLLGGPLLRASGELEVFHSTRGKRCWILSRRDRAARLASPSNLVKRNSAELPGRAYALDARREYQVAADVACRVHVIDGG